MMGLTQKQKACLDYIEAYIAERGISPLYKEMCHHLGLKTHSAVFLLIEQLVQRGAIERTRSRARSITVCRSATAITVDPLPEVRREIDAYAASQKISVKTAAEQALREWFMEPSS